MCCGNGCSCSESTKCCCCIDLHCGCITILIFNIISYIIWFAQRYEPEYSKAMSCFGFLMSIVGLIGIHQKSRSVVMIYFYWMFLCLVALIVFCIIVLVVWGGLCNDGVDAAMEGTEGDPAMDSLNDGVTAYCVLIVAMPLIVVLSVYTPIVGHYMCVFRSYAHSLEPESVSTWL